MSYMSKCVFADLYFVFPSASQNSTSSSALLLYAMWTNGDREPSFWQVWTGAFTSNPVHSGEKTAQYLLAGTDCYVNICFSLNLLFSFWSILARYLGHLLVKMKCCLAVLFCSSEIVFRVERLLSILCLCVQLTFY